MSIAKYHLSTQPIPEGFQIFEDNVPVAGVNFRRAEVLAFAKADDVWLELERDSENIHDSNAIKVIGCCKILQGLKRYTIGFVPRGLAKVIIEKDYFKTLLPRLSKTYVDDFGYIEVVFQILGPKGSKKQFLAHFR